jgi:hypothetical protein
MLVHYFPSWVNQIYSPVPPGVSLVDFQTAEEVEGNSPDRQRLFHFFQIGVNQFLRPSSGSSIAICGVPKPRINSSGTREKSSFFRHINRFVHV